MYKKNIRLRQERKSDLSKQHLSTRVNKMALYVKQTKGINNSYIYMKFKKTKMF